MFYHARDLRAMKYIEFENVSYLFETYFLPPFELLFTILEDYFSFNKKQYHISNRILLLKTFKNAIRKQQIDKIRNVEINTKMFLRIR